MFCFILKKITGLTKKGTNIRTGQSHPSEDGIDQNWTNIRLNRLIRLVRFNRFKFNRFNRFNRFIRFN